MPRPHPSQLAARLVATLAAAATLFGLSAAHAQPVLITAPQTLNPGATTITPTAGGAPVPLATADITVSGTTLTINGRHTIRDLLVQNNGTVTHSASFTFDYSGGGGTDVVNGLWLSVQANPTGGSVTVQSGSGFNVTGKGFGSDQGPGAGTASSNGSLGGAGGGHGGDGANSGTLTGGLSYGSITQPITQGSGGGSYFGNPGGAGGGSVRLIVSGALTFNGSVMAAGIPGISSAGSGAGGSIWITAGSLSGTGTLQALGGNGGNIWGGGGGGRIAVYTCASTSETSMSVSGGTANQGNGQPGTIYLNTAIITQQPISVVNCELSQANFEVLVVGPGPYTYQWRKNSVNLTDGLTPTGTLITGSAAQQLSLTSVSTSDIGSYDCIVSTACGGLTSTSATLGITTPCALADIVSDPLETDLCANGSIGPEDLDAFIAAFISGNLLADVASDSLDTTFNPNGFVGSEDLDAFIASFIAGC